MSSSSGAEQTLSSPTEQGNAPVADMDAKLMVATGSGGVQQLKDLVNKQQEQDSEVMVVVMAKQQAAASAEKPHQKNMDPLLLALASSGSAEELQTLLNGEDGQACGNGDASESLSTRRASSYADDDTEANVSILEGVTAEGDTAFHVVAASGQGDNFLNSASIIHGKDKMLLFAQNNKGDTPLHCAARAGNYKMVARLIKLALEDNMIYLLRIQNKDKETALHQAVRVGNKDIVDLLMENDSELASFPEDAGASPMYLAIVLKRVEIAKTLYDKSSDGKLSFSGPDGQNALHAAVLRYEDPEDLTELLRWIEAHPDPRNKDRITKQRDENGSTPLHFAAARNMESSICRQVLRANPNALYQSDHAGLFPIHVAASVGAFNNIDMFIMEFPGSAGLRDAKGMTFLHVAVTKCNAKIIKSACRNQSLSWIMNMVDNDGNTALHLAVMAGSLRLFCPLLANPQVNLNLPNSRRETPLDIAHSNISGEMYYSQNSEAQIRSTLQIAGAVEGVCRLDHLIESIIQTVNKHSKSNKEVEVLKDSTGTLSIGSVLIATVTFGTTFAVPGGYIADDHSNGGSPTLARRYAFDAFIASNTLAFVFATMATVALMQSGSPLFNPRSRRMHLSTAFYLVSISITCLAAAFALGAYVVLAPVAHKTAVATCVLSSLVLLYSSVECFGRHLLLQLALRARMGLIWTIFTISNGFIYHMLYYYWPFSIHLWLGRACKPGSNITSTYTTGLRHHKNVTNMWSRQT